MFKPLIVASALAAAPVGMASAQVSLISVNLSNVNIEIAKNLDLDLDKVPINVLLPISVAANVCGIDVAALGGATLGGDKPECNANNVTMATQLVSNLIGSGSAAQAPENSTGTEPGTADTTESGVTAEAPTGEATEPTAADTGQDAAEPSVDATAGETTPPSTSDGDATAAPQAETGASPEPVTETSDPASDPAADASADSGSEASQTDAAAQ